MAAAEDPSRETLPDGKSRPASSSVRRFRLTIVEGAETGRSWDSDDDVLAIGQDQLNQVVLGEPTVSRFHCEIRLDERGARVRDLNSLNGVVVDGVRVLEAFLHTRSTLRLGATVLRFDFLPDTKVLSLADFDRFGDLRGQTAPMRRLFSSLERASKAQATVLLEGETGTGKSRAARALHRMSARAQQPFLVVDCAALPAALLESELFGHEKGAFTGAVARRAGVFEEANGGTVFLDEIGELPLELQPKLLRVLEDREVRRLGANQHQLVDVRVIAATHRDLRAEVNGGRFRPDLYFRLAVVRITLPALREHIDDVPSIVDSLLDAMDATAEAKLRMRDPAFLERIKGQQWPGNVRELRNYLERCLVFDDSAVMEAPLGPTRTSEAVDTNRTYAEARRDVLDRFEKLYLQALLDKHGTVTAAAAAADIDRVYFHRLMRKHGLARE